MDWSTVKNCIDASGVPTLACIPAVFNNLIHAALMFVGVVAIFFIIYSGFQLVTSGGDAKKVSGARQTLTFAIIGLIIVLCSFGIIAVVGKLTNTSNCINNATKTNGDFLKGC